MEVHDHPDVVPAVLVLSHHLLVIGVAEEGQGDPVGAQRGLDDVGDDVLPGLLVEVGQILAGGVLMLGQVVVGRSATPQSSPPAEGNRYSKSVVALE